VPDTAEEWAEAVRAGFDGLDGPDALTGSVRVDVTGGPDGDLSMYADFDRGHLTGAGAGSGAGTGTGVGSGPAATLSLTAADAWAVLAGDLDPSVAFMQGRMKVTGDMGLVLDLLALAATDDFRARRQQLAGLSAN
jgi:hypothetical protein